MFSQITSIDIFSLPENTDKKFSIPILSFAAQLMVPLAVIGCLSKTIYALEPIVQFCYFVLSKSSPSYVLLVWLVSNRFIKANGIVYLLS